jgi:phosphate ABC transporter phosphate-binding protein
MIHRIAHRPSRPLVLSIVLALIAIVTVLPADAATYVPISGAGSTWSSNAISQWAANVAQFGMKVNFQATGSTDGRKQFTNNTVDFGVSEIPYGLTDNGVTEQPPARKYAYMPIVAGGTSIMYNLRIGNKRVENLRLSGETLTKIFTGVIKLWSDPAIKQDNPALTLPARKIIPVVRSDGSGTTAQFTLWMSKRYPALWNAYCAKAGRKTPCGLTSFYPTLPGSAFTAQSSSLGVSGYVAQKSSEGAITYVEYSYPLNLKFPVVKLLNSSGYYVLPKAPAVAVGLLKATINNNPSSADYLTQNLDGVYTNADRRAYPMSSYSYMIIPTKVEGSFSTAKGATLSAFAYYFLCEGQQQADDLGYSPLPINLVQAGLEQVRKIPGVNLKNIDIKKCNNPTFSANGTNTLATTAPYPPACDKQGPVQCTDSTAGRKPDPSTHGSSGGSGKADAGTGTTPGVGSGATTPAGGAGAASSAAVDPDTGQPIGTTNVDAANATALPVSSLSANYITGSTRKALMALAIVLLLAVAVGPPLVSRTLARGRQR